MEITCFLELGSPHQVQREEDIVLREGASLDMIQMEFQVSKCCQIVSQNSKSRWLIQGDLCLQKIIHIHKWNSP